MDVTIKDVPEEVVGSIKRQAMIVIDQHHRSLVVPAKSDVDTCEKAVDDCCTANGLIRKYGTEVSK